jgi:phenylalanyl-tRNA synthetase beta chain
VLISLKLIDKLFLTLPLRQESFPQGTPCWQRWDIALFAEILTRQGFEVESQTLRGSGFENIVVGRIVSAERHPKADKLQVCQVQVAANDVRQIVCGAANARSGLYVAVALPGAVLPAGLEIKVSKIRDVESHGMLCSREELGLNIDADRDGAGIWELERESSCGLPAEKLQPLIGQPVFCALGLDDVLFELNVTPNRPDLLGHEGAARELCAGLRYSGLVNLQLKPWPAEWNHRLSCEQLISEAQEMSELTTVAGRFMARNELGAPAFFIALDQVKVATTPGWMRNILEALGQKSINAVVDAGNLILLSFAQPNHAFDVKKLAVSADGVRQLTLRFAAETESFSGLDGKERTLTAHDCVVADSQNVQALLGVLGGEHSKVTLESSSLVLEFANPHPVLVRRTSRRHGRKTDSSFAFEKGIDVFRRAEAARKLVGLMSALQPAGAEQVKYIGATAARVNGPITETAKNYFPAAKDALAHLDAHKVFPADLYTISFSSDDLPVRVGSELVSFDRQLSILDALGFTVQRADPQALHVHVVVPTWRRLDVVGAADLVEEIVRVVGIDHVPAHPMTAVGRVAPDDAHLAVFEHAAQRMVSLGYHETAGFHFMRADDWKKLNQSHAGACGEPVALLNPIIKDEPLMQTTLVGGLLRKVAFNLNYGNRRGQIFEISRTFQNADAQARRVFESNGEGVGLAEQLRSCATLRPDFLFEYSPCKSLTLSQEETAIYRPAETTRLGGVVFGVEEEKEWLNNGERPWMLHRVASHVDELLKSVFGLQVTLQILPEHHPLQTALHPGRSAHVLVKQGSALHPIGWVAEFHPSTLRNFGIDSSCLGFELSVSEAFKLHTDQRQSANADLRRVNQQGVHSGVRLPSVERDFAFLVKEEITAAMLIHSLRNAVENYAIAAHGIPARLIDVKIFDVYRGQGVIQGHKSMAVRLTLLPTERTLVDSDISAISKAAVERLSQDCGAELRG